MPTVVGRSPSVVGRSPDRPTSPTAGLQILCGTAQTIGGDIGVRWGLLAATETLFLVPVIVVTFALQNYLLRGVTFGTIKR